MVSHELENALRSQLNNRPLLQPSRFYQFVPLLEMKPFAVITLLLSIHQSNVRHL